MDLKVAARAAGIRGGKIAEVLAVNKSTVSRWLNGQQIVSSEYVLPLAELLKVDPLEILPKGTGSNGHGQGSKRHRDTAAASKGGD